MSYDADTTSCGTVTFMPRLDETSPVLVGTLRMLMDNYGVRGVYDTCAQMVNQHSGGQTPDWVDEYGVTKGLAPTGGQLIGDVLKLDRQYTDDELRNSPYAGTFADVVAASQDPAPVTYTVDAITDAPDSFDAWKQQRGEATGDPQNVGPMGNR